MKTTLLLILIALSFISKAQTADTTFRLGHSMVSIYSSNDLLEFRDDGILKYNGKVIDTCKSANEVFQKMLVKIDSVREQKIYGWSYMVRVPANIHKHRVDGYIFTSIEDCKNSFVYNTGHPWQYYYNKGYRIVKVKIYEY